MQKYLTLTFSTVQNFGSRIVAARDQIESRSTPRLSIKEQVFFIKRLSFLIRANVPILEGLHMVKDQTTSRRHIRIVSKVIDDIANGQSLSKSLGKFPHIFGDFGINIIKVGESSGTLSQNLEYLADELKKRQALRRKVIGAFVYPAVVTFATLGITAFLMLYLFPKITPIFASLHSELPLSTKIVMAISVFLQHWGIAVLAGIALVSIACVVTLRRSTAFHFWFDRMIMRIPVIGPMIRYYNLAIATRTIGLLLKSGITLSEAIPLTGDTTQNLVYKYEFKNLAHTVNRGEQISNYLKKNRELFPDVMTQMIAVGERSGNLSNTLVYLSDFYEAEVDDFTKNLSSLIEPALMVIMGILVGFVAISIITPIYGITQSLHP
jgi:type II secretory pathway component PulF